MQKAHQPFKMKHVGFFQARIACPFYFGFLVCKPKRTPSARSYKASIYALPFWRMEVPWPKATPRNSLKRRSYRLRPRLGGAFHGAEVLDNLSICQMKGAGPNSPMPIRNWIIASRLEIRQKIGWKLLLVKKTDIEFVRSLYSRSWGMLILKKKSPVLKSQQKIIVAKNTIYLYYFIIMAFSCFYLYLIEHFHFASHPLSSYANRTGRLEESWLRWEAVQLVEGGRRKVMVVIDTYGYLWLEICLLIG